MAVIKSGASTDLWTIDAASKAGRVTLYDASGAAIALSNALPVVTRPKSLSLGSFSIAQNNGTSVMPAGALTAAELYQWRWTDAAKLCALRAVRFSLGTVIGYAAGKLEVQMKIARGFTAVGAGTGSTAAVFSTNNSQKRRTSHGLSAMLDTTAVIAGTAALSAGTKQFDNNAFGAIATAAPTTVGPIFTNQTLYARADTDEYPVTLAQNEGFSILIWAPATGTALFGVTVEWAEFTAAELP